MREELRRTNSIGNALGIESFIKALFDDGVVSIDAYKRLCDYIPAARLNASAAIFLFEDLGLITCNKSRIFLSELGHKVGAKKQQDRIDNLVKLSFESLISSGMVNCDSINYNSARSCIELSRSFFPLSTAVYRNFLISLSAINQTTGTTLTIDSTYQPLFESLVTEKRAKITQEQLLKKLENEAENGEAAELYVLDLESKRLDEYHQPKRISQIDVTAGYDIVSYKNNMSSTPDLFIEVKSYVGKERFYWTSNEKETANKLRSQYSIYLISTEALKETGKCEPIIINDPVVNINDEEWLIEPDVLLLTKI